MKKNILWVAILFSIAACKEEEIVSEVPEPEEAAPVWQLHESFLYDLKTQYNSYVHEDKLYFLGNEIISQVQIRDSVEESEHFLLGKYDQYHRMPIGPRLTLTANEERLIFKPNRNPVRGGSGFYMRMQGVDPSFVDFSFPNFWRSECMVINSRNECLIPYSYQINDTLNGSKVLLVTPNIWNPSPDDDFIDTLQTVQHVVSQYETRIDGLYVFDDNFYITERDGTRMLDASGTLKFVISATFQKMFKIDDELYGLSFGNLYSSSDGINWLLRGQLDDGFSSIIEFSVFRVVDGKTIGSYFSQIYHLEIEGNSVNVTELSNEGLEGNRITSFSKFHDKMYITTLSGVFTKNYEDFWMVKENEEEENVN
ncbi:hypothetical protein WJR50_26710 [Catalinimonas sp. 4WD22]|uniref:hypothetical protein n=1 Tax=Catalinimonas locisalis TaxID=3133978 RepID=UPI0031017D0F